jgi:hypothetical protein
MNAPIVVRASYADFRLVKTRSMFQVVLEGPIEQAEDFVTAFGLPIPGSERPVALALLKTEGGDAPLARLSPSPPACDAAPVAEQSASSGGAPRRRWSDLSASQQCGIRCAEKEFQEWLYRQTWGDATPQHATPEEWEEWAATDVRVRCNVITRRELDTDDFARARWLAIDVAYEQATGKMAKDYRS